MLSAGLAKLSSGYDQAIEAMQEVGEEENMKLEHRLSYMALIGTVSPMVGLLGTVQGMIASFSVIANSPTTPKPSELAEGISTALFTTLVGLFIAPSRPSRPTTSSATGLPGSCWKSESSAKG